MHTWDKPPLPFMRCINNVFDGFVTEFTKINMNINEVKGAGLTSEAVRRKLGDELKRLRNIELKKLDAQIKYFEDSK